MWPYRFNLWVSFTKIENFVVFIVGLIITLIVMQAYLYDELTLSLAFAGRGAQLGALGIGVSPSHPTARHLCILGQGCVCMCLYCS